MKSVGFFGLLTLILITLKLTGVITWSWWFVLAPLWLPVGITIVVVAIILAVMLAFNISNKTL